MLSPIEPLIEIPIDPLIASLPKVDLHVHAEASARLDRVLARREGRRSYDWRSWLPNLMSEIPPGMSRLVRLNADLVLSTDEFDVRPEYFVARIVDLLEEAAGDGAVLVEIRFGRDTVLLPDFMNLFREAERRVQKTYPQLRAEAIITLLLSYSHEEVEHLLSACIRAAREGLAGVDFLSDPYDTEADWTPVPKWAERATDAGLGITAHAAEFSTANLAAVLRIPSIRRIGHAVYAARDPRLLEQLAHSGVTVECCLTCNVVMGATTSYTEHPIRQFLAHGIPVTLNTDDPIRVCTTIGREYAIAAALGFSRTELLEVTRNAIQA